MPWIVYVIVALAIGALAGYWYGTVVGQDRGRVALLAEQEAAVEEELRVAQEQLADAANPFAGENPLEGGYQNPFKASVNPFAE